MIIAWIIPTLLECNICHSANMAACMGMITRVGGIALTVLHPVARRCSKRRIDVFIPHRFSHGVRSSLYEHVREGYSDKPDLDMRAVCEETDKVIANVESRKGDLRGDDVRKIVSNLAVCLNRSTQTVCMQEHYNSIAQFYWLFHLIILIVCLSLHCRYVCGRNSKQ